MKDLNNCCSESVCKNCPFKNFWTFCSLARAFPNSRFSSFIEGVRSELNKLDKDVEECEK